MRRRVLLVQPSLQPPGGGNGVAAWVLQALVEGHDVTVLTWRPLDVAPINRFFGTSLTANDFARREVPAAWRALDRLPVPASLLRTSLLMRYARTLAGEHDVVIGVHNEVDFGRRGIQYVHYPTYLRPRPQVDLRWYHVEPALDAYYRLADRVAGFSLERMRSNVTLANSNWTAAQLRASLGVDARTVYPPVVFDAPVPPWHERRPGFVAIGRMSPEKEYERIIRILARVRRLVPEVTLTIVGTVDAAARGYYERVRAAAASAGGDSWITFAHDVSRDQVRALIASHRYGIHGMREEHFGMAPAEMACAGSIVWVANGGGQVEIVGDAMELRYDSDDEAVDRILSVVGQAPVERRLREHLLARRELFSVTRFVSEIKDVVAAFRDRE